MDRMIKRKKAYHVVNWKILSKWTMKINFDASFMEDLDIVAWIARDHIGTLLRASIGSFTASDQFMAEALAANKSFKYASKNSIQNILFEGDALNIHRTLRGDREATNWRFSHIIDEGRRFMHK